MFLGKVGAQFSGGDRRRQGPKWKELRNAAKKLVLVKGDFPRGFRLPDATKAQSEGEVGAAFSRGKNQAAWPSSSSAFCATSSTSDCQFVSMLRAYGSASWTSETLPFFHEEISAKAS